MSTRHQLLFIQGGGADVHDEWDNKLVDSLTRELGSGFEIRYPRMPDEADPSYAAWKEALDEQLGRLDDGAIVVGHSIGATMLISALSEHAPAHRLGGVVLISAPFVGEGGWPSEIRLPADLGARLPTGVPVHIYHGLKDETAPASHAALYARAIPQGHVHLLPGRDHQFNNDLSEVAATIKSLDR